MSCKSGKYVVIYLAAIVVANLSVAAFGPAVMAINAFLLIGLDLTARDRLHESWLGKNLVWKMGLLIASGSVISWGLNRDAGRIALASMLAFGLAAAADGMVYHGLLGKRWLVKVNGSNIVGAMVDSLAFPTIAFGVVMPWVIAGQFMAKTMGGFLWSLIIKGGPRVGKPSTGFTWGM
jgi:queuosine precursor transporter